MLLDRGALVQEGPVYQPTGTIESLEVPETLHALIAARLDGLPAAERRVVQDAAVLGKTFTKQAVASLTGLPDGELEPILSSLSRKEVFGVQADPRSPEHGQYGFLQDLAAQGRLRDAGEGGPEGEALAAAAFLEQALAEQEVVEVVASHYLAAYEAAPDAADAAAIRTKAGEQLARAGERAASLGANEEAERYFSQAAGLEDDSVAKATLHERAGRMAWRGARAVEARALLEQAFAVFEAEGSTAGGADLGAPRRDRLPRWPSARGGRAARGGARHPRRARSRTRTSPTRPRSSGASSSSTSSTTRRSQAEVALELAEALRLPEVFAQALTSKSLLYSQRNRLEEGRILLEGALERALENDLHSRPSGRCNNLAVVYESNDQFAEAADLSDRGLDLARRVGDRVWEEMFLLGPISALVLLGRWDAALAREIEARAEGASGPDSGDAPRGDGVRAGGHRPGEEPSRSER